MSTLSNELEKVGKVHEMSNDLACTFKCLFESKNRLKERIDTINKQSNVNYNSKSIQNESDIELNTNEKENYSPSAEKTK